MGGGYCGINNPTMLTNYVTLGQFAGGEGVLQPFALPDQINVWALGDAAQVACFKKLIAGNPRLEQNTAEVEAILSYFIMDDPTKVNEMYAWITAPTAHINKEAALQAYGPENAEVEMSPVMNYLALVRHVNTDPTTTEEYKAKMKAEEAAKAKIEADKTTAVHEAVEPLGTQIAKLGKQNSALGQQAMINGGLGLFTGLVVALVVGLVAHRKRGNTGSTRQTSEYIKKISEMEEALRKIHIEVQRGERTSLVMPTPDMLKKFLLKKFPFLKDPRFENVGVDLAYFIVSKLPPSATDISPVQIKYSDIVGHLQEILGSKLTPEHIAQFGDLNKYLKMSDFAQMIQSEDQTASFSPSQTG